MLIQLYNDRCHTLSWSNAAQTSWICSLAFCWVWVVLLFLPIPGLKEFPTSRQQSFQCGQQPWEADFCRVINKIMFCQRNMLSSSAVIYMSSQFACFIMFHPARQQVLRSKLRPVTALGRWAGGVWMHPMIFLFSPLCFVLALCIKLIIVSSDGFIILYPLLLAQPRRHLGSWWTGCWKAGGWRRSGGGGGVYPDWWLEHVQHISPCAADPAFFFPSEALCWQASSSRLF